MTATMTPDAASVLAGDTDPLHHPSATPTQRALLEWAAANDPQRPACPKDARGQRYRAHVPGGDKERSWTRVTTFAEALDDGAGLTVWRHRLLAEGLVGTDNMVAAVRAALAVDDAADRKKRLSRHIDAALHNAGEKLSAALGTAFHTAMELAVLGGPRPPAPYDRDVDATLAAMVAAGLTPSVEHLEAQLWNPANEVIGTADLLVTGEWGDELRVADYKTGTGIERLGYAIQAWCYATATHLWTPDGWADVPPLDATVAYLIHTPLGSGTCEIVTVDLTVAAELARIAAAVRDARRSNTTKALFAVAITAEAPPAPTDDTPASDERSAWIRDRLRAIPAEHRQAVAHRWPEGVPTKAPWTNHHVEVIDAHLNRYETSFPGLDPAAPEPEMPTPEAEPAPLPPAAWDVIDDGTPADPATEEAVRARFEALAPAPTDLLRRWVADAKASGHPFALGRDSRTARTVAIQAAAVAALSAWWDDDYPEEILRLALAHVLERPIDPAWHVGAVLGALSHDQAQTIADLADAYAASHPDATALVGRLLAADPGGAPTNTKEP